MSEAFVNSSLVITPADPIRSEIRELIVELDSHLEALYPPESRHGLNLAAMQDQSVTVFLAKVDDAPAGCSSIKQLAPGYAEVKRMYVRPAFRGRGVGKRLLSTIETFAKQANVHTLRLETGIYQTEAIRLYERCGYSQIPPFGNYKPDSLSLFFEKPLT